MLLHTRARLFSKEKCRDLCALPFNSYSFPEWLIINFEPAVDVFIVVIIFFCLASTLAFQPLISGRMRRLHRLLVFLWQLQHRHFQTINLMGGLLLPFRLICFVSSGIYFLFWGNISFHIDISLVRLLFFSPSYCSSEHRIVGTPSVFCLPPLSSVILDLAGHWDGEYARLVYSHVPLKFFGCLRSAFWCPIKQILSDISLFLFDLF